ncbi:unnamed protein product [Paramecium octaurelia]|uniref:B box-type domain-containing protein n=1 Tax=Paramecium octaurelia TaxID=43137 RepID=A0A8S1XSV8_PAROT|nr:unnamed protein product [Paramecium octaurelia]
MSSLFVKCMTCNLKPATIKCSDCQPGQICRICYACDTQVHNKRGPMESQHKKEIIPYQEMYLKGQSSIRDQQTQSKPELKQKQSQLQYQQPQISNSTQQFTTSQKAGRTDVETKNLQQNKPFSAQNKDVSKLEQQNKFEIVQQQTKIKNNYVGKQENQEIIPDSSKELVEQIKKEKGVNQKLKSDLQQTKDQLQNINKEVEKRIQQNQKDLEKKISDLKKEYAEDKRKTEQLSEDVKKLKEQLKSTDQQATKKLDQQKKQYEQQLKQLEQVAQEKQDQIEEIAQEFQNYNFEDIQAKMEEMGNDINQRDQLIQDMQHQLQEKYQGDKQNDGQIAENEELKVQLEQKSQEIEKLEELIDNFKQLYQHMLDEKQVLVDENEKLVSENNQFRELFSQNLHLFGIDPNDLEGGDEDETGAEAEAEDYRQHEEDEG